MQTNQKYRQTRNKSYAAQMKTIPSCPVLYPTQQEFADFFGFVTKVEKKYQKEFGMVKVVAPQEWKPHSGFTPDFIQNLPIKGPIEQLAIGKKGFYQAYLETKKSMTLKDYMQKVCVQDQANVKLSAEQVQAKFWNTVNLEPPLYGADIQNSLMDQKAQAWNLNKLQSLVKVAFGEEEKCSGVNSCYLYVGSWKSFFAWHKEDLDLSAINFMHEGKSKFWYSVPPHQSQLLESVAKRHYPQLSAKCPQFLRHKTTLMNPYSLMSECPELRVSKVEHKPNEFMLVFGGAYHTGFNFGFNIAEAINYATLHWLETVPDSRYCNCSKSSVKINLIELRNNLLSYPLAIGKQFRTLTRKLEAMYGKEAVSGKIVEEINQDDSGGNTTVKEGVSCQTVISYDDFIDQASELAEQIMIKNEWMMEE